MKLFVNVKLKAKQAKVEKMAENHFDVFINEPPIEGRANEAVIKSISGYFKIPKSRIKIISGVRSRHKILQIT